jgi:hypothetical protein
VYGILSIGSYRPYSTVRYGIWYDRSLSPASRHSPPMDHGDLYTSMKGKRTISDYSMSELIVVETNTEGVLIAFVVNLIVARCVCSGLLHFLLLATLSCSL